MVTYVLCVDEFLTSAVIKDKHLVFIHTYPYTESCLDNVYLELVSFPIDRCCVVFDTLLSVVSLTDDSLEIRRVERDNFTYSVYLNRIDFEAIIHVFKAAGKTDVRFVDKSGIYEMNEGAFLRHSNGFYQLLVSGRDGISSVAMVPLNNCTDVLRRCQSTIINAEMFYDREFVEKYVSIVDGLNVDVFSKLMVLAYAVSSEAEAFCFDQSILTEPKREEEKKETKDTEVRGRRRSKDNGVGERRRSKDNGAGERRRSKGSGAKFGVKKLSQVQSSDEYSADVKPQKLKSNYRKKSAPVSTLLCTLLVVASLGSIPAKDFVAKQEEYALQEKANLEQQMASVNEQLFVYQQFASQEVCNSKVLAAQEILSVDDKVQFGMLRVENNSVIAVLSCKSKKVQSKYVKQLKTLPSVLEYSTDKKKVQASLSTYGITGNTKEYDLFGNGCLVFAVVNAG